MTQTSTPSSAFDFSPTDADPDIGTEKFGSSSLRSATAAAGYAPSGGRATAELWSVSPVECGPFSTPAPAGSATDTATATIQAFDPAAVPASGDLWQASVNPAAAFTPVTINPGQSATINLTITPSAAAGTVVSGTLYVDDTAAAIPPDAQTSGAEATAIPYQYTAGS